jgi:hypothetical protein
MFVGAIAAHENSERAEKYRVWGARQMSLGQATARGGSLIVLKLPVILQTKSAIFG